MSVGTRVSITLGTDELLSEPGAEVQLGGIENEAVATDRGIILRKEKVIPSSVKCDVSNIAERDMIAIKKFRGPITVKFLETNVTYTIPGGFYMKDGGLKDGKLNGLELGGGEAKKQ